MTASPGRLRLAVGLWALAVAAVAGTASLGFDWAMIDDGVLVARRPTVFAPGSQPPWDLLTTPGMGHAMPVTNVTLAVDHALYGLNPSGWHASNVVWFAGVLALIAWLGVRVLQPSGWGGALTVAVLTALMGWHPITAEPLGWISSRKDLVAAAFATAAVLSLGRTHMTIVCAALALAAKSTMVALGPPLAVGLWLSGASRVVVARFAVGWALAGSVAVALARRQQAETWERTMSASERALAWVASTGDHIRRVLWPFDVPVYATPDVLAPTWGDVALTVAMLVALCASVWSLWSRRTALPNTAGSQDALADAALPLGVLGAVCALAPVVVGASSLVTALADRYVFAVWVPWVALASFGAVAHLQRSAALGWGRVLVTLAALALALALLPKHQQRLEAWRSPAAFYAHATTTADIRASDALGDAWSCYWRGSVFVASPDHARVSFAASDVERDLRLMLAYHAWNACAPGPSEGCAEDRALACAMRNLVRSDRDRALRLWRAAARPTPSGVSGTRQ